MRHHEGRLVAPRWVAEILLSCHVAAEDLLDFLFRWREFVLLAYIVNYEVHVVKYIPVLWSISLCCSLDLCTIESDTNLHPLVTRPHPHARHPHPAKNKGNRRKRYNDRRTTPTYAHAVNGGWSCLGDAERERRLPSCSRMMTVAVWL